MRGLFVTGTGTGVGKTVLAAAIIAALRARGTAATALKPVITGLDEAPGHDWPPDHELLARAADCSPDQVAPVRYGPAVSPHLAAELTGRAVCPEELCDAAHLAARDADAVIVEGVGGLLVPLTGEYDVRRLALDLGLPLVVAAPPGLGTINHSLLTLESARSAGLEIAGVVLTPWPPAPTEIERSNRVTIERLGGVAVSTLPVVARADVELLAAAGDQLPLEEWLGERRNGRLGRRR